MSKENKKRLIVTLFGIISIVMLLAGMSYAAFSSDILGNEENVVKAGCLKIDMQDSGNLNITNAIPQKDEKGLQNEPYTYTLTNTCSVDATYITTLNVMDDTNLENLSKMRISLNGDSNLAPITQNELKEIESVDKSEKNIAKTYMIDEGTLAVGESKTFHLRSWVDYEVTEITGKVHNKIIVYSEALHNKTIAYSTKSAAYQALKNMLVLSNNQYSYDTILNQTGLVKVTEDNKMKYYLRGNPDNYIKFGTNENGENYTWRILSANEDGSINIVLDSIYASGTYSALETNLNELYIDLQKDEKYIKTDSTFCEEIDKEDFGYLAKLRVENYSPTSICKTENYLTKIALPTADDLMYAGAVTGQVNDSFYLASGTDYFTQTHASTTTVYAYKTTDSLTEIDKTTTLGIKPVITLSKDAIIEGTGTENEPFYVTGLYTEEKHVDIDDTVAPEIIFARVDEEWSKENKTIRISAKDNLQGSGIAGYIVKKVKEKPSLTDTEWESSAAITYTTINKYANGTYYVFAKDASGNISNAKQVVIEKVDTVVPVCTLKINPNGEASSYKILTIESTDPYINKNAYSWEHITSKEDVIRINQNGVYTAYIEDLAGNKGTCSATVTTVVPKNLDTSGANEPELSSAMIAVYYDEKESTWRKADQDNENKEYKWYDYDEKMWANSVTVTETMRTTYKNAPLGTQIKMDDILTMQVWVPRYKYKVWNYNLDGTVTSEPQEIQITFEKGTNSTGEIKCTDNVQGTSDGTKNGTEPTTSEICKINNTNCTDTTCNNKTYTHPAFTFGDEELEGIWVGKFEASSDITCTVTRDAAVNQEGTCNVDTIRPLIKPNETSWRGAMVSVFENNMMAMNDSNNKYGFTSTDDTHMIKNMEWGAVAYLSHSKYGINKEIANNSNTIPETGCGPQSEGSTSSGSKCNAYDTSLGQTSSTTGNIYGIYDMSGGSSEYVMGNMVSPNGTTMMSGNRANTSYPNRHSGYDGILYYNGTTSAGYGTYDGTYSYPDNKYIDKYSFNTSSDTKGRSKLGDGIREVFNESYYGWYSDVSDLAYSGSPWFNRGGFYSDGSFAGVFFSNNFVGNVNTNSSSRLVISLLSSGNQSQLSNAVYSWSTENVPLGASKDSISGHTTDYTTIGKNHFLKHNLAADNTVESQEVCYLLDSKIYCLKGDSGASYETNKAILLESFGEENCGVDPDPYAVGTDCFAPDLFVYAAGGTVSASDHDTKCGVDYYGIARCYE